MAKTKVSVTYSTTVDFGELSDSAIKELIHAGGDSGNWSVFEANAKVTLEEIDLSH